MGWWIVFGAAQWYLYHAWQSLSICFVDPVNLIMRILSWQIKKHNRKCEILLHDVEFLYTLLYATKAVNYPSRQLGRLWKLLLLNQFHDVLPGTSIELVDIPCVCLEIYYNFVSFAKANNDAIAYYEDIANAGNELLQNGIRSFIGNNEIKHHAVMNTLSWERSEVVEMPDKTLSRVNCILSVTLIIGCVLSNL